MITLHHLNFSRSTRVIWLLEELGLDYKLVKHDRDQNFRAPPSLAEVHPLGRAPVLVEGDLVLAESGAILRYLEGKYGDGRLAPAPGTADRARHDEWLDFVESSAGLSVMLTVIGGMTGGLQGFLKGYAASDLDHKLRYISDQIAERPFLMGEGLTLADIQMSYLLELLRSADQLREYPLVVAYLNRLGQMPGLKKAVEIGGPMSVPAQKQ